MALKDWKKTKVDEINAWAFSDTAKEKPIYKESVYLFLKSKYTDGMIFGIDNLKSYGVFKIAGWSFDFKPYLKQFYVEQYGSIQKYYAPNKTMLRKTIYGKIDKIQELN